MKVSTADKPKVIALVVAIAACLIFIGSTFLKTRAALANNPTASNSSATNPLVVGQPQQTAALEPSVDIAEYVKNIEQWSQPPPAVPGDPFRTVLPRDVMQSFRSVPRPTPQIGGNGFGNDALNPGLPNPDAMIDFPEIHVGGVIVDSSNGSPTNWAVLHIGDQTTYAKAGDVIGNGLKVDRVTELGVWVWAAKEHAFIEVSKSYKPNGMAPPAPPAVHAKHHSARR